MSLEDFYSVALGEPLAVLFVTVVAAVIACYPVILFLVALLERARVPTFGLVPGLPTRSLQQSGTVSYERLGLATPEAGTVFHAAIVSALNNGFEYIGHFVDGVRGIRRTTIAFALSPDGVVLLVVAHGFGGRMRFMTRLHSGLWVITSTQRLIADMSGLEFEERTISREFEANLLHHLKRVGEWGDLTALTFTSGTAVEDYVLHIRDCLERMVERGLVKWLDREHALYGYTAKGAMWVMLGVFYHVGRLFRPVPPARPPAPVASAAESNRLQN